MRRMRAMRRIEAGGVGRRPTNFGVRVPRFVTDAMSFAHARLVASGECPVFADGRMLGIFGVESGVPARVPSLCMAEQLGSVHARPGLLGGHIRRIRRWA